jgi:riboflavin biosynthesis pyrimidine reductase
MPARADGRPSVRVNMIESVDGAATLSGRSGGLSGAADKALFRTLRAAADVVLVGAGTVRAERYGPVRLTDEQRAARTASGLDAVPPIAVVSASCEFDVESPFFTSAESRPVVVTVEAAPPAARARLAEAADVVVAGETTVDLARALGVLGDRGWTDVLAEGGPTVVGQLVADDLMDELCVTLSPRLVSGEAPRIALGQPMEHVRHLHLLVLLEEEGFVFARYGRGEDAPS